MISRIADRYRVESSLGRGGMGEVFAALDEHTGERVALKVLRRESAAPHGVERLLREAAAAGRVQHPNVVKVFAAGEDDDCGVAYIAQELLSGETLRALLTRRGRLAPSEALAVLIPVASALAAAHEVGVLHRDLKPENIFLQRVEGAPPRPRVIDFGIARFVEPDPELIVSQLTPAGSIVGTPTYMSPEQTRGARDVDEQSDIWALGVVLYELLTGATPFARSSLPATLAAILLDPVTSPRESTPEVPEALAAVTLRALARNRVERYGSMRELLDALHDASAVDAITRPSSAQRPLQPSQRRTLIFAAGLVGVAIFASLGWVLSARRPPSEMRGPSVTSAPAVDASTPLVTR